MACCAERASCWVQAALSACSRSNGVLAKNVSCCCNPCCCNPCCCCNSCGCCCNS